MTTTVLEQIDTTISRETLLDRLRNARSWPEWSPFTDVEIMKAGVAGPGSVGEVRRFRTASTMTLEEVLPSSGDIVLRYRLLKGLPLRNYVAEVRIEEHGTGRTIVWSSSFDPLVPFTGGLFARELAKFLRQTLAALVSESVKAA